MSDLRPGPGGLSAYRAQLSSKCLGLSLPARMEGCIVVAEGYVGYPRPSGRAKERLKRGA